MLVTMATTNFCFCKVETPRALFFGRHIFILVLFVNCVLECSRFYDQKFCKNRSIIKIQ